MKTANKCIYKVFGLNMMSDLIFPELKILNNMKQDIDITVQINYMLLEDNELKNNPYRHFVKEGQVQFHIPEVASFTVEAGKQITVSPINGADEGLLRLYILGTCMGVILMQRRVIPLHGSAIEINGKAYAFVAESGVGKSTLAAAFINCGYKLVSDDVIAVSYSDVNLPPLVTPSYPQQKLWQESLAEFGMTSNEYTSIFGRETKYSVPVTSQFYNKVLPLGGIFELLKEEMESPKVQKLNKLESLQTLYQHTYRNFIIPRLGLMDWHFKTSANILNHNEVFQLRRPEEGCSASKLTSLILNTLNVEG